MLEKKVSIKSKKKKVKNNKKIQHSKYYDTSDQLKILIKKRKKWLIISGNQTFNNCYTTQLFIHA